MYRVAKSAVAMACAVGVVALLPSVAFATDGSSAPSPDRRSVTVTAPGRSSGATGSSGGRSSGSGSAGRSSRVSAPPTCYTERGRSVDVRVGPLEWKPAVSENWLFPYPPDDVHVWQITHCLFSDGHRTNRVALIDTTPVPGAPSAPAPRLSAQQLALRATADLQFDFPAFGVSPASPRQVVGFPMWVWVDPASWVPRQASDTDAGLVVTLTATPSTMLFDPGDGSPVVDCHGPGTPYRPGSGWQASPTCGHTYTVPSSRLPGSRTPTTATIIWTFGWVASDGTSGTLPDLQLVHHEMLTVTAYTAVTN